MAQAHVAHLPLPSWYASHATRTQYGSRSTQHHTAHRNVKILRVLRAKQASAIHNITQTAMHVHLRIVHLFFVTQPASQPQQATRNSQYNLLLTTRTTQRNNTTRSTTRNDHQHTTRTKEPITPRYIVYTHIEATRTQIIMTNNIRICPATT